MLYLAKPIVPVSPWMHLCWVMATATSLGMESEPEPIGRQQNLSTPLTVRCVTAGRTPEAETLMLTNPQRVRKTSHRSIPRLRPSRFWKRPGGSDTLALGSALDMSDRGVEVTAVPSGWRLSSRHHWSKVKPSTLWTVSVVKPALIPQLPCVIRQTYGCLRR